MPHDIESLAKLRFAESHAEHEKNVADFNEYQRKKDNGG